MMMPSFKLRNLAAWLTLMLSPVTLPAEEIPTLDAYQVEIIVFQHQDQSRNTAEVPAADRGPVLLPAETAVPLRPEPNFLLLSPRSVAPAQALPSQTLQLNRVLSRLQQLDAYQPLAHFGWLQVATAKGDAENYWLDATIPETTGLSGFLKVYKERFLHLAVDLQFLPRDGSAASFSISESRRLRDEELQYFDNPRFGVIASVRRVQDELETSEQTPQASR